MAGICARVAHTGRPANGQKGAGMKEAIRQTAICDKCGSEFSFRELIEEQIIAQDPDAGQIKERFFCCPVCGEHYTVLIFSRSMLLKIQKRKQIGMKIRRSWGHASKAQFESWQAMDAELKTELKAEAAALKRKYGRKAGPL